MLLRQVLLFLSSLLLVRLVRQLHCLPLEGSFTTTWRPVVIVQWLPLSVAQYQDYVRVAQNLVQTDHSLIAEAIAEAGV